MDKVKCMPFIILCMLLTGCGNKNNISEEVSTETAVHTSEIELKERRNPVLKMLQKQRQKAPLNLTRKQWQKKALKPI